MKYLLKELRVCNKDDVIQSLSHVWLFANPWIAGCKASLSFTTSQSLLKLMSIVSMMPSNHLILCQPLLLLLSIFPSTRLFLMSCFFALGSQSIGASASASVLPMIIQGWFPLELTGLISLLSKGLSRVFSNSSKPSVLWCSAFFMLQLSKPYVTTGKTKALTTQTFVDRVMSLLFNTLSRFVIAFLPRSNCLRFHGCRHGPQWF